MSGGILQALAVTLAPLSLMMFGGANAVVPEIHRQVVELAGWMDDREFATLFAIAQAAPGPNILIVSLIGWRVAGWAGLLVATAAINLPHCVLTYAIGRSLGRAGARPWLRRAEAALVPISVGLILASGLVMARAADRGLAGLAITAGTAAFVASSRRNPLWALGTSLALGVLAARLGVAV